MLDATELAISGSPRGVALKSLLLSLGMKVEHALSVAVIGVMTLLPVAEVAAREFGGRSLFPVLPVVQHLTLWITFLGAALATGSGRLVAMATPGFLPERLRKASLLATSIIGAGVAGWLAVASLEVIRIKQELGGIVAWGIPTWVAVTVMPAGFVLIAVRLLWKSSSEARGRALALITLVVLIGAAGLAVPADLAASGILMPALIVLGLAVVLGLPVFAGLGGAALLLFWSDGLPSMSVALEAYQISATANLPVIPLFAFAGYLLAEGKASQRLMRAFNAAVGWMPGGLAIVITILLAFFTTLGSGVTILSLGGLILPLMMKAGYSEKTSVGLVTVGGSTGLLFPPSLPVILYGAAAGTPIDKLFIGGFFPGVLLVAVVAGWGALQGHWAACKRQMFTIRELIAAAWQARWDLLTPVLVVAVILYGKANLVEAAALMVVYVLFVECVVHRELGLRKDIPRIAVECATTVGGFLIIMGVALAFTSYMVQAEVPMKVLGWVQTQITSPLVFLLVLNVFLIVVGAVTDIYSAILVVVPLIVPISGAYGIDPVHLGVIFLTNMELGYLMPPMGENLFLSSLRFDKKLSWIYRSTLPYLVLLLAVVLLVTYVPFVTLAPVSWFR